MSNKCIRLDLNTIFRYVFKNKNNNIKEIYLLENWNLLKKLF